MASSLKITPEKLNADGAGRLSDSDDSSSSSGHTSDGDDQNEDDDGHPMMSIFASYYGIEDSSPAQDNKPKGTIDDAGFQAEQYVKVSSCCSWSALAI